LERAGTQEGFGGEYMGYGDRVRNQYGRWVHMHPVRKNEVGKGPLVEHNVRNT
jgi:hypothetical protein